jgi:hypothetical protein
MLIHDIFQSQQYAALSARAVKLLLDLYCQYRGENNGDLCATWSVMAKLGWTSKSQLGKALTELEARGWVLRTRQGSINKPSLYAVTWCGIDACGGKLDPGVTCDPMPSNLWKLAEALEPKALSARKVRKLHRPALDTGQRCPSVRGNGAATLRLLTKTALSLPLRAGTFIDIYQVGTEFLTQSMAAHE